MATIGAGGAAKEEAQKVYETYREAGGNFIDTANLYTNGSGNVPGAFGGLDAESQALPPEYRSHGGLSEAEVPLVAFNASGVPDAGYFRSNVDLARWLVSDR